MKTLLTLLVLLFSSSLIGQDIKIEDLPTRNVDNNLNDLTGINIFCKKEILNKNKINIILIGFAFEDESFVRYDYYKGSEKSSDNATKPIRYDNYKTSLMEIYISGININFTINRRNLNIESDDEMLNFKGENCVVSKEHFIDLFKKAIQEELNKNIL